MLFTEPIVAFFSLYIAFNFAMLFTFFAAFPYVFEKVYHFSTEQSGLVFLAIGIGCVLGAITVMICDWCFYQPRFRAAKENGGNGIVAPEYRLYPALMGSVGLPIGLFWFAWTAREGVSWASPVVAAIPFAWGNMCVFIGEFCLLFTPQVIECQLMCGNYSWCYVPHRYLPGSQWRECSSGKWIVEIHFWRRISSVHSPDVYESGNSLGNEFVGVRYGGTVAYPVGVVQVWTTNQSEEYISYDQSGGGKWKNWANHK
jgi:hypothetical protein